MIRKVHDRLSDFLKQVTLAQIAHDADYGMVQVGIERHCVGTEISH